MQFHNQSNRVAPDTALRPGSEKRVSSHRRVQGSLTPTSALRAADLSTLPPKTIMQESTLLGEHGKKHQYFKSKCQGSNGSGCWWWPGEDSRAGRVHAARVTILPPTLSCHCNGNDGAHRVVTGTEMSCHR